MREFGRVQASSDPVSTVLEFLWEAHQGPMFVATVELWVAARTDDVLAAHIERVEPVVNSTLIAAIAQLVPDHAVQKELRNFVYTAMDALRGILLSSFVDRDSDRVRRRWDRACEHLRVIVAGLMTSRIDRLICSEENARRPTRTRCKDTIRCVCFDGRS